MAHRTGLRGERLVEARERLHMTQGELAVAIGIAADPDSKPGKTTISRYENERNQPGSDVLDKMTEVLNVSADWLLGRTEDRTGSVTENSLPDDEIEMLNAYRHSQLDKAVNLMLKKRSETPNHNPGKY
jgi:transcriptional regulator with XRE-family HTH domain